MRHVLVAGSRLTGYIDYSSTSSDGVGFDFKYSQHIGFTCQLWEFYLSDWLDSSSRRVCHPYRLPDEKPSGLDAKTIESSPQLCVETQIERNIKGRKGSQKRGFSPWESRAGKRVLWFTTTRRNSCVHLRGRISRWKEESSRFLWWPMEEEDQ